MDVIINENPIDVPTEVATWGDLLDWLETEHLKAGQCITHVYLDGSESLNYRDNYICGREIDAVGKIAVHSGDFDQVIRESLGELDTELKNATASVAEIIRLLENRQEQEAYNRLALLLDSIRIFFTVFSEDLGWADAADAEISGPELSATLETALNQLIAAQENRYWVSICDVLEYEITPILQSWNKTVEKTRAHIN
jgi:hypothetical protein